MSRMFYAARKFNQPLNNWDIKGGVFASSIFEACPIKEEYKPKFIK
jgi:hypothetical protein